MNRAIIKFVNRAKFLMVLTFLNSMLCFSVMAQDKPMSAKSRAALVTELKGVVARFEPDEKNSALVAQKWDARKDLAGKTKSQVINLLYEDVKSVIKDSGTQYQIYSTFSFYKQMPDEAPSVETPTSSSAASKDKLVENLANVTFAMHPYIGIEEELAKLPGIKDVKAAQEEDRKNRIEGFDAALRLNNKLTSDQKAFVKANYDRLIKIIDKITTDAINKNFPTDQWIMEGLKQSYSKNFTNKELADLTAFFDSDNGQQILKYIRQTNMAELITGNGGTLNFTPQDKSEHDKFAAAALGKKFIAAYIKETEGYEHRKEVAVRFANPDADGFAIYQPENLNRLFNRFVKENYKQ